MGNKRLEACPICLGSLASADGVLGGAQVCDNCGAWYDNEEDDN